MQRIAIIGIGCRFPGRVDGPGSFWSLLTDGRCAIGEIPADRWSLAGFHDARAELANRSYSKWGGFLSDIRGFDAAWFGLSPREAEAMDPQQRLLLQVACEAAQDARLPIAELRRAETGVFIGVSNIDYALLQRYRPGTGDIQAGTGTALSIVANRVSNRLDLSGPSMGLDTACSSSLVALDTACRHLSDGSCGMALAGGVNILLDPRMFITFSRAHMLSPTGRIRAFDAGADGFVRGEGVGVVLLRRLDDALAAGDRIYAVIEATAVNQDGRTGTITEPSRQAQIAMIETVARRAGITPRDVAYVEAHGTGTPVGDPIEVNAIGHVLGGGERSTPLRIGSVKTNIGHLEPAAGIAGLIKAALVLHHGAIPPSLGFERPNPAIDFDAHQIEVVRQLSPLSADSAHVLVNSFGFGGTNACAVLSGVGWVKPGCAEALPGATQHSTVRRAVLGRAALDPTYDHPIPIPLSAPTPRHLQAYAATLADAIELGHLATCSLPEIAAALAGQRDHHAHRVVVVAASTDGLRDRLRYIADGREWPRAERHAAPEIIAGTAKPGRKLCFTMTGQGGQWWAMGRELIQREPVFRRTIESFDRVFLSVGGWSVIAELLADEAVSRIDDAAITPAVMFAFQTALAEVWRARGIIPDIVLGHSFGEVTAAYLAGGLEAKEIARLVNQRGLIRHRVDRVGTMAAIGLGAEEIAPLLPADGSIEIGGYNSPSMVTLTGEEAAIDALIARLNAEDPSILTRKLALDFAYHSSWFEPVEQHFMSHVSALATAAPRLPVVSTVTGALNDRFDAAYWWQNLRYPVRYQQAVETALDLGADVFVELGPHRTLSSMTAACAAAKACEVVTVTSLDRRWGDLVSLAVGTGQLWAAGVEVDWSAMLGSGGRDTDLPRMPWLDQPLWVEPEEAGRHLRPSALHPLLGRPVAGPGHDWLGEVALSTHAWLGDHRLDGACVFPAAAYLEMLYAAACAALGADAIELSDIAFPAALFIGSDDEVQLATRYTPERRQLTIHSRVRGGTPDWELRATAKALPFAEASTPTQGHAAVVLPLHGASALAPDHFYRSASSAGYGWGRQFQGLVEIRHCPGAARGVLRASEDSDQIACALDPRLLDSALQLMLASGAAQDLLGVMPTGIARMVVTGELGQEAVALGRTQPLDATGAISAEIDIATGTGLPLVRIEGLTARRRHRTTSAPAASPRHYREVLVTLPDVAGTTLPASWLMLAGEQCDRARAIADGLRELGCTVALHGIKLSEDVSSVGIAALIEDARGRWPEVALLYAVPLAGAADRDGEIAEAATGEALGIIALGRALASLKNGALPALTVLTHGVRTRSDESSQGTAGLVQSPVLAAARTIAMEMPELGLRLVDLDDIALWDGSALCRALSAEPGETEIVIREGNALGVRLEPVTFETIAKVARPVRDVPRGSIVVLRHGGAPGPDGLFWRAAPATPPAAGEVRVATRAVGLNFRDVMAVSGLLPAQAESGAAIEALGLELSGIVEAVGAGVTSLTAGDHVLGMGRGALQSAVVLPAASLHRAPAGMSHEAAATLPSAYLTAHYALDAIARLQPGETVLIHSATGGVGLAAIALARRVGARIIATAGTPEKRAHLHGMGLEHVFDSRSLRFADDVGIATDGRGVDVVLNALGGPFIAKGLDCLAPYGRFIELGKRDIYEDSALGLRAMRANVSFHVVDLAALIVDKPELAARMMREVLGMLSGGEIAPLPSTLFPASEVAAAFRHLAAARHIGKVVIGMDDPGMAVRNAYAEGAPLDPDGTYLVTGGTRGFGLEVGRWLAGRGAGRVVLASPTGAQPEDLAHNMEAIRLDVTRRADVEHLVASLTHTDKPLRGIVHAAVTYDDALLPAMTADKVRSALAPKIAGAINLTRAVEQSSSRLDFFVTFSSLAQTIGWPGQSNYAAANGFLETLAHWQRGRGIKGQCISWGALGESGHVARRTGMQSYLESSGWIGMSNEVALAELGRALDLDLPAIAIAAANWSRLAGAHPAIARARRIGSLIGSASGTAASGRVLADLDADRLELAALDLVRAQTARVLRSHMADLAPETTLAEAGIDSLSSFELHNRIEQEAGLAIPMPRFVKARRIGELAALLASIVLEARSNEERK